MLCAKELEDLHDDNFEGSLEERNIFREVFFGNNINNQKADCLFSGVINYGCNSLKHTDVSACSNSDNSALTSLSFSKNFLLEEPLTIQEHARSVYASSDAMEELSIEERNGSSVHLDQNLFLVDKLSNSANNTRQALDSSVQTDENSHMSYLEDPFLHTFGFYIAESSSLGIACSSFLLKKHKRVDPDTTIAPNGWFLGSDGFGKLPVSKAIASPVPQGSFVPRKVVAALPARESGFCRKEYTGSRTVYSDIYATREVVAALPVRIADKNKVSVHVQGGPTNNELALVAVSDNAPKTNPIQDPRKLLHDHAIHLLKAAGWVVTTHQRPDKRHPGSLFQSPDGSLCREFTTAWRLCGQMLQVPQLDSMPEYDGMEWNDISRFFTDVWDMLLRIENEADELKSPSSLTHQWNVLDPFVNVVFIERKIAMLRKGEIIKARRSLICNKFKRRRASSSLEYEGNHENGLVVTPLAAIVGDSQGTMSDFNVLDTNYVAYSEQSSNKYFSNHGTQRTEGGIKLLTGISVYTAKCGGNFSVETADESVDHCNRSKSSHLDPLSLSVSKYDNTGSSTGSCPYFPPLSSGSVDSLHEGSQMLSCRTYPHYDKQSLGHNLDRHEVVEDVSMSTHMCNDKFIKDGANCYVDADAFLGTDRKSVLQRTHLGFSVPPEESHLSDLMTSEVVEQSENMGVEDEKFLDVEVMRKKVRRKSRKISEIKSAVSYQKEIIGQALPNVRNSPALYTCDPQLELSEVQDNEALDIQDDSSQKYQAHSICENETEEIGHRDKKIPQGFHGMVKGQKRGRKCEINDDDLLVSAIIKNRKFNPGSNRSVRKMKSHRSKVRRMRRTRKARCGLLPCNLVKGGKFSMDSRTVLSWMIGSGVISTKDVIQCRNPKDNTVVKKGQVTRDGIICKCCSKVLSVTRFKIHAGFKLNHPSLNLFIESGQPFALCKLEAWSSEYKMRKSRSSIMQVDENDPNDDSCGLCGDGGELICCDNCPSTFHQACLLAEDLPDGSWYCPNCTCQSCGRLVDDREPLSSSDALKCCQCERKYHQSCIQEGNLHLALPDGWFCSASCHENAAGSISHCIHLHITEKTWLYSGLHSRIGLINQIGDGYSWTLLRCIHEDQKVHSAQRFVLKAECNSKLAVALTIMEECFVPMVDPRTGIDMIPHALYNWRSDFARLNFHGFYTVVLEKDDVLISVASIRLHGVAVAEMPLVATCSKYRRQGMCHRLLSAIEELLKSFKVEKLVIAAIPELLKTWIEGFGFMVMEDDEREKLKTLNLVVFPGTVLLKKPLGDQKSDLQPGEHLNECGAFSFANEATYPTEMSWKKGEQSWGNEVVDKAGPRDGIKLKSCDPSQDLMIKCVVSCGNSGANEAAFVMEMAQNEREQSQGIEVTANTEPLVCVQGAVGMSPLGTTPEEASSQHVDQANDSSSCDKNIKLVVQAVTTSTSGAIYPMDEHHAKRIGQADDNASSDVAIVSVSKPANVLSPGAISSEEPQSNGICDSHDNHRDKAINAPIAEAANYISGEISPCEELGSKHARRPDDGPCGNEVDRKSSLTEQKDRQETDMIIPALEHDTMHQASNLLTTTDREDRSSKEEEQEDDQLALFLETSCHGVEPAYSLVVESHPEVGYNAGSQTQLCFETAVKESQIGKCTGTSK